MKKVHYVFMFVCYALVSVVFDWMLGETVNVAKTLVSSCLVVIVYSVIMGSLGEVIKKMLGK